MTRKHSVGDVIIFKHHNYSSGMYIAMMLVKDGFWQQISPNYTYKSALIKWCNKRGIKLTNA